MADDGSADTREELWHRIAPRSRFGATSAIRCHLRQSSAGIQWTRDCAEAEWRNSVAPVWAKVGPIWRFWAQSGATVPPAWRRAGSLIPVHNQVSPLSWARRRGRGGTRTGNKVLQADRENKYPLAISIIRHSQQNRTARSLPDVKNRVQKTKKYRSHQLANIE